MPFSHKLMDDNITDKDIKSVKKLLHSKDKIFTQSKNVFAFEKAWSKWLDVKYSVFVNSGSSANLLTITILKILKGKGEVVVPTLTWISDIASVLQNNLDPVFVDINLSNLPSFIKNTFSDISKSQIFYCIPFIAFFPQIYCNIAIFQ